MRRKQAHRPRGYTRVELAGKLACGRATIERLVARGLEPIGRRGQAHVYRLADARRLRARQARKDSAPDAVLVADYISQAEDLRDRTEGLRREWLADAVWLPVWRAVTTWFKPKTASWPARIADVLAAVPRSKAYLIPWTDGPRLLPSRPAGCAGPEALATWEQTCREAESVKPLFRPLLASLAADLATCRPLHRLSEIVASPKPARPPRAPRTVDAAREQWRVARAEYRRQRVAIRRGHHQRQAVRVAVAAAFRLHTATWWACRGQAARHAGDRAAALAWARQVRQEALTTFAALGGLVPAEKPRRRSARRKGGKQ